MTIIDQADALVGPAQNALLKTLEEPLPASVFVLVTSRPDTLLPTVRSRCAHLRFGRLQVAEVASVLERRQGYSHADALDGGRGVRRQRAVVRSISRQESLLMRGAMQRISCRWPDAIRAPVWNTRKIF